VLALEDDGRFRRDGVELEINAFLPSCHRDRVTLVRDHGANVAVQSRARSASDALREALAGGAESSRADLGSSFRRLDTLATGPRAGCSAATLGQFDLIITGRNTVDADTGQVGPELAELLDLPFAAGVRSFEEIDGASQCQRCDALRARRRLDRCRDRTTGVISCAERLCDPTKVKPDVWCEIPVDRVERLTAGDLAGGPWGQARSPTSVGAVRGTR